MKKRSMDEVRREVEHVKETVDGQTTLAKDDLLWILLVRPWDTQEAQDS